MRRHVLALIGAVALAAPMLATGTALAADPPGQTGIPTALAGEQRGAVDLNWSPPDPADGIVGYQVRYSSNDGRDWSDPPITTGSTHNAFTVTGLDVRQVYVFQVRAYNAGTASQPVGDSWGPWSNKSLVPVSPAQSVGPPSFINTNSGNRSATLDWEEPSPNPKETQVRVSTSPDGPWTPTTPPSSTNDRITVVGLTPGTTYYFQLRSFNTEADASAWTPAPKSATPTGVPDAPTNVQASAGNGSATVTWSAVSPTPNFYEVQYRAGSGSWVSLTTTQALSATATGLTNGVSYQFQVRASLGGAVSTWALSNVVVPVAPLVPTAPTSVSGYGTDSAIVVSWTMLAGQPVTNSLNNAQWFPTTPITTGRIDQTFVLGGLSNGQPYFIRVAAANGALQSAFTQMPGTVTPLDVPGPPRSLTGTAGNASVTLTWQQPIILGPTAPITGYRVQYSTTGGATWFSAPDVTSPVTTTVVGGLSNGTGYIFRVRATSYSGDGAWSAVTGVITPPGGPTPPTSVAATAGDSRANVSWVAPSNPASSIVGYRVTAAPGGQTCTTSAVPPSTPTTACTVTGLTNGQSYTFTVVAVTTSGTSAPSAPSNAVTPSGQTVSIRITSSGRNGNQVFARGATTGLTSGTTVTALIRNKAGAAFRPAGQVAVQDDGTFSWSTNTGKKTWIRFTSGGVTSSTVIVGAR